LISAKNPPEGKQNHFLKCYRHHVVLTPEGDRLIRFAVLHRKGEKRQVLDVYVKQVMKVIAEDKARWQSKKGGGQ